MMAEQATRAFQSVVGIVGICGNGLVCAVIAKVRFMHTLTNAFIFNQALIDLLGSLVTLLLNVAPIPDPIPPGATGVFICAMWESGYLQRGLFTASTFNLVVLTLERYLAIVFPFKYQALTYHKRAIAAIFAGFWVCGFLFNGFGIYLRYYVAGECVLNPVAHPEALGVFIFACRFLVPFFVMLAVYVHIAVVLKKGAGRVLPAPAAAGPSTGHAPEGQGESLMRARRNTFKTLMIVSTIFVICWAPSEVNFFLFNLGVEVDFNSPIFHIMIGLGALNCCLNPFIYAIKYKQFQKALKVVFCKRGDEASLSTVSTGRN